jgi:hypothetical protein
VNTRFIRAALPLCLALAGCKDSPTRPPEQGELDRARAATVKYQDISRALADGYVDINVVMPNMGRHYMKQALVDDRFDVDRPEILVYAPEGGEMRLVAVEYAIPLDRSTAAPEGFTGAGDVWDHNTNFQLWLLHAWVHRDNPRGVFSPTNPLVP